MQPRQRLLTAEFSAFLGYSALGMASFFLMVSVVPWSASQRGGSPAQAGLLTGATMAATVIAELLVPRLLSALGYRPAFLAAIAVGGLPSLALLDDRYFVLVLLGCLARGAGLAVLVVAGTALVVELVPVSRRGEALGLYGLALSLPAVICTPGGLVLARAAGLPSVVLVVLAGTLAASVLVIFTVPRSPVPHLSAAGPGLVRQPRLRRLTVALVATTMTAGVFVTFLPITAPSAVIGVAPLALLVQALLAATARWLAGRFSDRRAGTGVLRLALLLAAAGTGLTALAAQPWLVVVGLGLFGVGYGATQNISLTLMLGHASGAEVTRISALWNIAFDAGLGCGAVGFGYLIRATGYSGGLLVLAVVMLLALAVQSRRAATGGRSRPDCPAGESVPVRA